MRYIVTGGTGFVGSHLVNRLINEGHKVLVIDDLSSGKLSNLIASANVTTIVADIRNLIKLKSIFSQFPCDAVFHLGALVLTVQSLLAPQDYADVNINGTINVLEAMRVNNIKRIVFTSSAACYGAPKDLPVKETAPIAPLQPYALSKYISEQYMLNFCKIYAINSVALRLFYVYGPNTRDNSVFSIFANQIRKGLPLTVKGSGNQQTDYVHVDDVIEALILAMNSDKNGEVYNVGTGKYNSINDIAKMLTDNIIFIEKSDNEPECIYADITKIREKLGWEPKVSLMEGIHSII